uniref:Uncharacterized protein n=1 Tax=Clastoptera arizonana TaxID=38151 RepID=A0A1B6CKA4_9HEMI
MFTRDKLIQIDENKNMENIKIKSSNDINKSNDNVSLFSENESNMNFNQTGKNELFFWSNVGLIKYKIKSRTAIYDFDDTKESLKTDFLKRNLKKSWSDNDSEVSMQSVMVHTFNYKLSENESFEKVSKIKHIVLNDNDLKVILAKQNLKNDSFSIQSIYPSNTRKQVSKNIPLDCYSKTKRWINQKLCSEKHVNKLSVHE